MAHKKIPLASLRVGMYLIGVDRSWLQTPFLRHKFKIAHQSELDALQRAGVREVTIDSEHGLDVEDPQGVSPSTGTEEIHAGDSCDSIAPKDSLPADRPSAIHLADNLAVAKQCRAEWMNRLSQLFEGTRATGLVSYHEVARLVDDMIGVIAERQAACSAVNSLRDTDPTLYEHGLTVCTLSIILGQALQQPRPVLQQIGIAAILHDIGLTRLPRNILKRTRGVTPAQQALYDSHPHQGIATLEKSGVVDPAILAVVRGHHDLQGAAGISSDAIQGHTRLVGIVDQYDELLTGQSGLPPLSSTQAMTQLYQRYRQQASLLDDVSYLIRIIGVYPLYSLVALNSGELGVVGSITPGKAHLPTLYLCRDGQGSSCTPAMELDLAREPEGGRVIHNIRDPRVEGIDVESILREVAA